MLGRISGSLGKTKQLEHLFCFGTSEGSDEEAKGKEAALSFASSCDAISVQSYSMAMAAIARNLAETMSDQIIKRKGSFSPPSKTVFSFGGGKEGGRKGRRETGGAKRESRVSSHLPSTSLHMWFPFFFFCFPFSRLWLRWCSFSPPSTALEREIGWEKPGEKSIGLSYPAMASYPAFDFVTNGCRVVNYAGGFAFPSKVARLFAGYLAEESCNVYEEAMKSYATGEHSQVKAEIPDAPLIASEKKKTALRLFFRRRVVRRLSFPFLHCCK